MTDQTILSRSNAVFVDTLYQQFETNPESVPSDWRQYFSSLSSTESKANGKVDEAISAQLSAHAYEQVKVLDLISAFRYRGHRQADIDPLKLTERLPTADLELETYGFTAKDMQNIFNTGSLFGIGHEATLEEIFNLLKETYLQSIGIEVGFISSNTQQRWLQNYLESRRSKANFSVEKKHDIMRWVTASRKLEDYLHRKYVGQKRFSLEGAENLIPCLDELIQRGGSQGVKEIVVGMAHRGRLNVLVNILGKHPGDLFGEFEGVRDENVGSGDVKYHLGFSSDIETPGGPVHTVLAFNPSHLEIINPVVEGSVRARQERRATTNGSNEVLPILVHGDAAFAGQGVVPETLNLSETRGYGTGGTIHIVVNNQIGFTTSDPLDSRSTLYCTDVAKLVQAPILHVNGNDAEAVVLASQLALDFRQEFHKDIVIDIVCFRRWGHNESDEPFATQPMMYKRIAEQHGPRRIYAQRLADEGVLSLDETNKMCDDYFAALEKNEIVSRPHSKADIPHVADWIPYINTPWRSDYDSSISAEDIGSLGYKLTEYPENFVLHRSVQRVIDNRRKMASGEQAMDWGFAENLAYASLLNEGYSVRISGQDSQRGTFFHRHAVLHNQEVKGTHTPLEHISDTPFQFRVINSLLSEEAVLAFEFGYSSSEPESLVIWEAQFGDFVNGAQVVIDQFLSSSEVKWGRYSGLAMLLPHGYDGQGPEHSSARLERFLQLCAEENMQVCVPTTPAQIFHLLRRQLIRPHRKPLIVMSPKSLLRHRSAVSTHQDLMISGFQTVIDEVDNVNANDVTRLILCSGKIYYDLVQKRSELNMQNIVVVRVEQLYPFPKEEIDAILAKYPNAKNVVWAQDEPRNQGSWFFMLSRRHLSGCLSPEHKLIYAGRTYSASPAVGYLSLHKEQQAKLVNTALGLD